MTVSLGDVVRVTAILTDATEGQIQNVFWAKQVVGSETDADWMDACATQLEVMYDGLVTYQPEELSYTEIRGFNVTADAPLTTISWPTLTTGDIDVANPMPAPCSLLVFGRTQGNQRVGRKYLSCFTEADHANGNWQSSLLAAAAQFASDWAAAWATSVSNTAQFGVYSRVLESWVPMIEMVVRSVVAYQRRRRAGRGV